MYVFGRLTFSIHILSDITQILNFFGNGLFEQPPNILILIIISILSLNVCPSA
jgi:hypothetical protein